MENFQLLLHMYENQRDQLAFRRSRENEIFTWTASVLLAFIGGALLVNSSDRPALLQTPEGAVLASVALGVVTIFSIIWQLKQRKLMAEHQKRLVAIQEALGCFTVGVASFPDSWKGWGTRNVTLRERLFYPSKIAATVLIGVMAIAAAALGNVQEDQHSDRAEVEETIGNSPPNPAAPADQKAPLSGR